jgi:hypothetical protein
LSTIFLVHFVVFSCSRNLLDLGKVWFGVSALCGMSLLAFGQALDRL